MTQINQVDFGDSHRLDHYFIYAYDDFICIQFESDELRTDRIFPIFSRQENCFLFKFHQKKIKQFTSNTVKAMCFENTLCVGTFTNKQNSTDIAIVCIVFGSMGSNSTIFQRNEEVRIVHINQFSNSERCTDFFNGMRIPCTKYFIEYCAVILVCIATTQRASGWKCQVENIFVEQSE